MTKTIAILALAALGLLAQNSDLGSNYALNFPKEGSVDNYVMLDPDFTEAQDELSVCSWLKITNDEGNNYWFSYATASLHNTIVLSVTADQWLSTTTSANTRLDFEYDITLIKNVWYHHCFTWKSGEADFYINGVEIENEGTGPTGQTILGGTLVLGQEQDSQGGSFDVNQVFHGEMYQLNVFKKKLSLEEVTGMFVGGRCTPLALSLSYEVILTWEDIMNTDREGAVTAVDAGCDISSE